MGILERDCSRIGSVCVDLAMPESVKEKGKAMRASTRVTEKRLKTLNCTSGTCYRRLLQ